jgi:hypothetical protein
MSLGRRDHKLFCDSQKGIVLSREQHLLLYTAQMSEQTTHKISETKSTDCTVV